jgi:hypothetical protein
MIYNPNNCAFRTRVYDVDTKEQINLVLSIDADEMTLLVHDLDATIHGSHIPSRVIRYTTIYPIFGDSMFPVLFHCYGRKN